MKLLKLYLKNTALAIGLLCSVFLSDFACEKDKKIFSVARRKSLPVTFDDNEMRVEKDNNKDDLCKENSPLIISTSELIRSGSDSKTKWRLISQVGGKIKVVRYGSADKKAQPLFISEKEEESSDKDKSACSCEIW